MGNPNRSVRSLRVVVAVVGGVPLLSATLLLPALPGCNADPVLGTGRLEDASAQVVDSSIIVDLSSSPPPSDAAVAFDLAPDLDVSGRCLGTTVTHVVPLPPPGVPADPASLCAAMPPAMSSAAARVSFSQFDPFTRVARGLVTVPADVKRLLVGTPVVTVHGASDPGLASLDARGFLEVPEGFSFQASWPRLEPNIEGGSLEVKTTLTMQCVGGGREVVESITPIDLCYDDKAFSFAGAGQSCTVCRIIAEMAPSPIVPDGVDDGLPLSRVIRLGVRELVRAGRRVLLLADNDGGAEARYEWRVSEGELEHVAPDVVLWTLPEETVRPFGQVAVSNAAGAAVENFLWSRV